MDWRRPLVALIVVGIVVWAVAAAYRLVGGLVVEPDARSLVVLGLVSVAVLAMVLVGRRSGRWTDNPDHYW